MKELKTNVLIAGAGVTGLMMANCLDKDYIILEKETEIGGFCRTIRRNGYIWDYAGHFFHFSTKNMQDFFETALDETDLIKCRKNTKIWYKNSLINYPFQKNIHELEKEEFIDCMYELYFKEEKLEYQNFQDMLYGKFGKAITEKFLKPYNEKLYACTLDLLDVNAMGRFFPTATLPDIIANMKNCNPESYNDNFFYPKNGAEKFVEILSEKIDQNNILTNAELTGVNIQNNTATVKLEGELCQIHYNHLINTTPLPMFLRCLNRKEFQNLSYKLDYNKVLVFNIGFDKNSGSFSEYHWIYFPDKDLNFYRVGFYNNILHMDKMSLYVEIGFSKDETINMEQELRKTLCGLSKVGIINGHKVIDCQPIVMSPAYVYINSCQAKQIEDKLNLLRKDNIYSIGRYGAWKYCSIEDSMLDSINLFHREKF